MEGQPKTSFIPKKPVKVSNAVPVQGSSGGKKSRKGKTIFSLIAVIIFIGSLAALGGMYFYKFTLAQRIEAQIDSLEKTKDEFDEAFIQDATRLNRRINNATDLLENHLSPSSIFTLLEEYTLQTVSFTGFVFTDTKDGLVQVAGTGEAARFESIVLQSDSFGNSGLMRNVLFTNLASNLETGVVSFSFSATLDPKIILYRNSLPESFSGDNEENN
jgi:hypothetical protein